MVFFQKWFVLWRSISLIQHNEVHDPDEWNRTEMQNTFFHLILSNSNDINDLRNIEERMAVEWKTRPNQIFLHHFLPEDEGMDKLVNDFQSMFPFRQYGFTLLCWLLNQIDFF